MCRCGRLDAPSETRAAEKNGTDATANGMLTKRLGPPCSVSDGGKRLAPVEPRGAKIERPERECADESERDRQWWLGCN